MWESHESGVIRANFETSPTWSAQQVRLFSDRPNLLLEKSYWHDNVQMAVKRWYLVDAESNDVRIYSQTVVEHSKFELVNLIDAEEFTFSDAPEDWTSGNDDGSPEFYPLVTVAKLTHLIGNRMTIKLAVAGGNRGARFDQILGGLKEQIKMVAICDPEEQVRSQWTKGRPEIKAYAQFEDMVEDPEIDAVFIATPMLLHAGQALTAMTAGKHVLSEVIAATTLDECHALVEMVESTGLTYMMAENYCYRREAMMIKNMVEQNVFGDLTYAEGAYIHDCRDLMFNTDYSRTWRGGGEGTGNTQASRGNGYPTHSLGPVAQWLGINRSDRLKRTTTFVTKSAARQEWARSVLPKGHFDTQDSAWSNFTDSATTLIETEQGRVICLRKDSASPRPHNSALHTLQGTNGAYMSGRFDGEDPLMWIDGVSKGVSPANFRYENKARPPGPANEVHPEWQPLWDLSDHYEHPYWKDLGEEAIQAGHGGGDYFVMYDFARAVAGEIEPPIDVYDAVTWSSIFPISIENVARNGEPLDIPNFKN